MEGREIEGSGEVDLINVAVGDLIFHVVNGGLEILLGDGRRKALGRRPWCFAAGLYVVLTDGNKPFGEILKERIGKNAVGFARVAEVLGEFVAKETEPGGEKIIAW